MKLVLGSVLILGGYGNFGKRIAFGLTERGVPVIIAGRDGNKDYRAAENCIAAGVHYIDLADGRDASARFASRQAWRADCCT